MLSKENLSGEYMLLKLSKPICGVQKLRVK